MFQKNTAVIINTPHFNDSFFLFKTLYLFIIKHLLLNLHSAPGLPNSTSVVARTHSCIVSNSDPDSVT